MSRWPGGIIRKTSVVPTNSFSTTPAPGVWTLDQATQLIRAGTWPNPSVNAVEDVFSTYLYTGNGSTQTITNGIDLAGQGGLWWAKGRSNPGNLGGHGLVDTVRGAGKMLQSNTTGAQFSTAGGEFVTSFNSNGVTIGNDNTFNRSGELTVGWTFRKAPKFFDVVTYTGNGASPRQIAHSLGVAPGCIIVKATSGTGWWRVYHRSRGSGEAGALQNTNAFVGDSVWGYTDPTTTSFYVSSDLNDSGTTYVAYLFAHDTSSTGLIQCGSYTGNGSATGPTVTLGWEPQYLMIKNASGTGNWQIVDNMRGMPVGSADATLQANLSNAESSVDYVSPAATGFQVTSSSAEVNTNASTYIYIAIRRGPMKTPTVGTSVFAPVTYTGNGSTQTVGTLQASDTALLRPYRGFTNSPAFFDRLRGNGARLQTPTTTAQATNSLFMQFTNSMNVTVGTDTEYNGSGASNLAYLFRRAPGFFDVVCYTGNGGSAPFNHNLGVAPELIITKRRNVSSSWNVGAQFSLTGHLILELSLTDQAYAASYNTALYFGAQPTATQFYPGNASGSGASGGTYVAYLFATCPGVSKVGSYTGNGSSQTINCGFSGGARFFLVKRTDSSGDWWVWDSARGITAPADPALTLNTTAAEITSADATDPDNSGIIVNQETTCNINVNGATYIFLAIA